MKKFYVFEASMCRLILLTAKVLFGAHILFLPYLSSAQGLPLEYYLKEGNRALEEDQYSEAEKFFEMAWLKYDRSEKLNAAAHLEELGDRYYNQHGWEKAEVSYRIAAGYLEGERGPDDLELARILQKLAAVYRHLKNHYVISESLYQRVFAIRERVLGPNHPEVADSLHNLGMAVYFPEGRLAQAEPMFERALVIRETALGPDHPKVAESVGIFAFIRDFQGKYEEAEALYKRALKIWEKSLGPNSSEVAQSLYNLATVYQFQREYDKADAVWQKYLANLKTRLGSDHPEFISASEYYSRRFWKTENKE